MISLKKNTCRLLVLAMMALSFQTAGAGMIGTDQASADGGVASQRSALLGALTRAETVSQLQALGVDITAARERIAAMTDQEVRQFAGTMQAAPAGGDGGAVALLFAFTVLLLFMFRM